MKTLTNTSTKVDKIESIVFVPVTDGRLHVFKSAIEKADFVRCHPDAVIYPNYAVEPLYILVDSESTGFVLT